LAGYRPCLYVCHRRNPICNDPQTAIALLKSARPYELAYLEVVDVRAQAYLTAKQGAKAQAGYQKLIDHPAVEEPTTPRTTLTHLGLARALAAQQNLSASAAAYQAFFTTWKDADPDIPVLCQAHLEYDRLGSVSKALGTNQGHNSQ